MLEILCENFSSPKNREKALHSVRDFENTVLVFLLTIPEDPIRFKCACDITLLLGI